MLGSKTTSCMIDEEFIRNVPNQPYPPIYGTGGCFPDSEGHMLQGISPGWGDTYDYFRFEQWIDLGAEGSLSDGQYVLRSVADPLNKIYESPGKADPSRESQEDNEAITEFAVSGGKLVDSNPPSGSVRINDIDVSTSSPNVIVKVLGRDDVSDVTEVRLSNDGSAWSAPAPYTAHESEAQAIDWDLIDPAYGGTDSDGTKTVYAEFRDASGKWSEPETDTIVLDRSGNSSPYSNAVLSDGPSGYWRLGETARHDRQRRGGRQPRRLRKRPGARPAEPAAGRSRPTRRSASTAATTTSTSTAPARSARRTAVSVEAWIKPAALPAEGEFASVASKPGSYSLQFNGPRLEFKIDPAGGSRRLQAPRGCDRSGTRLLRGRHLRRDDPAALRRRGRSRRGRPAGGTDLEPRRRPQDRLLGRRRRILRRRRSTRSRSTPPLSRPLGSMPTTRRGSSARLPTRRSTRPAG